MIDLTDPRFGYDANGDLNYVESLGQWIGDDDDGYWSADFDQMHCRYGTFTGYQGSADFMCGACESGEE